MDEMALPDLLRSSLQLVARKMMDAAAAQQAVCKMAPEAEERKRTLVLLRAWVQAHTIVELPWALR